MFGREVIVMLRAGGIEVHSLLGKFSVVGLAPHLGMPGKVGLILLSGRRILTATVKVLINLRLLGFV